MKVWGVIIEGAVLLISGGLVTKAILQAYLNKKRGKDED